MIHRPHSYNRHTLRQSHGGSVVIAVLLMALIVISTVTLYLRTAVQEMKYAERTFALQQGVNLAEMGAEDAIWAMNHDNWNDWTELAPNQYYRTYSPNGSTDTIYTFVDKQIASSVWLATGSEVSVVGGNVEKQLFIRLGYRSMFANGLTAKNRVLFNGNQIKVDSYDSTVGAYNSTSNRNDNGSIASISVEVDSVIIQNADILGSVSTGGSYPKVGSQGSIKSFSTPSGTKVDSSRVAQDFYADFPDVVKPSTTGAQTSLSSAFMGTFGANTKYKLNSMYIGSSSTLYIAGNVTLVLDDELNVRGDIIVLPGSSLKLYIDGNMDLGGSGIINLAGKPENLQVYGTASANDGQEFDMHGNALMSAVIYAPNAELSLKGGGSSGSFYGAAVAKYITINGNYDFHYDEALKDFAPDQTYKMLEWRELTAAADRYPLDTPSALVATTTNP